jgi:hypothetical protein
MSPTAYGLTGRAVSQQDSAIEATRPSALARGVNRCVAALRPQEYGQTDDPESERLVMSKNWIWALGVGGALLVVAYRQPVRRPNPLPNAPQRGIQESCATE